MKRRHLFLFSILFTLLFWGYHARQFGAGSMISILSLASCISLFSFFFMFSRVGNR